MKSPHSAMAATFAAIHAVQALTIEHGTITSMLPAITVSSCPSSATGLPSVVPIIASDVDNTPTYTTVLSQPYSTGFVPITYTIEGQPTGIPSGFTTAIAAMNSNTQTITYPTGSASGYLRSSYITPSNVNGSPANGVSESAAGSPTVAASHSSTVEGNLGSGNSQGSPASTKGGSNSHSGLASSQVLTGSITNPSSAAGSGVRNPSQGAASGVDGSRTPGSPSSQPKSPSSSTRPASTSGVMIFTGGAITAHTIDLAAGHIVAALLAVGILI